jgi:hypothetical protein
MLAFSCSLSWLFGRVQDCSGACGGMTSLPETECTFHATETCDGPGLVRQYQSWRTHKLSVCGPPDAGIYSILLGKAKLELHDSSKAVDISKVASAFAIRSIAGIYSIGCLTEIAPRARPFHQYGEISPERCR